MIERTTIPNLSNSGDTREIGYATGDDDFPLARARFVALPDMDAREFIPNAPVAPARIRALLSVSLVDENGAVLRVAGRLLVGPESKPSHQFDSDVPFDPEGWRDEVAEPQIAHVVRWAKGLSAAAAAGLLPE